jgi:mono/diheme cytochrome c family protein
MKKYLLVLSVSLLSLQGWSQAKKKPVSKSAATAMTPVMKASIEKGKTVYMSYCMACHQADGAGIPNMNPPLAKTEYVLGDKLRLINIVLNGLTEEMTINGEEYSNPMPPHNFLKDDEIADVLSYVRNNFGNKASVITKAEVIKARKQNTAK